MRKIRPVSFIDFVLPLSQEKTLLLLELLDPLVGESLDFTFAVSSFLGIKTDHLPNDYEVFIRSGYLIAEQELSETTILWAETALDFFRQKKLRNAVKAYVFINNEFIGHSHDGHTSTGDLLEELGRPQAANH